MAGGRKFGGKRYKWKGASLSKRRAKKKKKALKAQGFLVRIVEYSGTYNVYARKKKKGR